MSPLLWGLGLAFLLSRRSDGAAASESPRREPEPDRKPEPERKPPTGTLPQRISLPVEGEIRDRLGAERSHGPHQGIDIYATSGSAVRAWGNGTVARVIDGRQSESESRRRAGLWVDVYGDDGNTHRYLHLGSASVKRGQRVTRGVSIIGTVEHDHLHFEVRQGHGNYGAPTEPMI